MSNDVLQFIPCLDCGEPVPVRNDEPAPVAARCNSCKDHKGLWKKSILAKTDGLCAYCGRPLSRFHREHVIPRSRGGPSLADNLVASCASCNHRKRTKTLDEFRAWILESGTERRRAANFFESFTDFYEWARPMLSEQDITEIEQGIVALADALLALLERFEQSTVTFELDKRGIDLLMGGTLEES